MSRCRSCNAPVMWTVLPTGRRMPVDPHPVEDGNVKVDTGRYHTSGGHPADVLDSREVAEDDGPLYESHFRTCPDADKWRNRG